ncbi:MULTISPECIES: hypothetical protein [unclassified Mesorhizobium]|uniref:hypothetical protein n=1 Tax=unclassified Mesorhizobium TaxID=325217 RepID=UPI0016746A21|nr:MULTISPECIES: hypothetical protein [unclassified Mesorhizobium]
MTLRKTLLASLAILALAAAPALADNGHGGGNGNGGSHGGGNGNGGNGNGGGNAGGNGNSGATHGKSASAPGHNKTTDDGSTDDTTTAAAPTAATPNIHSKLGRLNSLQRNINAYMHSKSKKFAGIQSYVTQAAAAQNAQAALDAANAKLAADQAALTELSAQLAAAQLDPTTPPATITDLENQIAALNTAITVDDPQAIADAQAAVTANPAPTDASLDTALQDMANKPVDQEVTDWAKGVLADKIDQAAAATAP